MKIGKVMKKWRLMSEMSLDEAARMIKIDKATYFRVEEGRMPSAETLRAILHFLLSDS
jgi:transcriptional regulator with XRE-family HTH domain